jgi:hypothetical protein
MNKLLCSLIFLTLSAHALAAPCEVYGISDSPQKLDCSFDKIDVGLRCQNGTYFVDSSRVNNAYHLEVEEGASPLVFKSPDLQLTVTIHSKRNIEAELNRDGKLFNGKCRL